ncbi:MAG: acyltransferase [Prevotella sp.]|nr:acyltransferase [Prevotella sp.]
MIATLQSLRFIFVMMIFMSHFAYQGAAAFDAGGDCGVAFFFLLSGFVLTLGYGPQLDQGTFSYRRYLRRRLLKLYPLHWLCLAVLLVAGRCGLGLSTVLNALLLQCWVALKDYYFSCNSVSWFLSCLLFSYLVFPWLYRHASRSLTAVVLLLCAAVYLLVPYDHVNSLLYVNPLIRCADFYLGMLLARLYQRRPEAPAAVSGPWLEPLLVVLLALALAAYPYADEKLRNAPLYWAVLLPLLLVFAWGKGPVSRLLRLKPLRWLGSLSMPVFLLHPMTIALLTGLLPSLPYPVMLVLCIAAVVLLSWATDRFFLRYIEQKR